MDVKYIPSDWKKVRDGIGDLIGLGRWGKGMIDTLKDLSDNLEDAEEDIAKYDSDGVITFRHTSHKSKYQSLYEDFQVLHSFSGKVGDIVERTIDQPFYEDMDAFVAAMQEDLSRTIPPRTVSEPPKHNTCTVAMVRPRHLPFLRRK